jgi:putative phage-type endonuclease
MQIELEQGSLGWHEHRAKYRNASESGAVMGVSPYQTPRELWESKNGIGKKFVGNVATDYGIAMEPKALARLEEILDVKLEPTVFVD